MDLLLQGGNGKPRRPELFSNADSGNARKEPCSGIGLLSWLLTNPTLIKTVWCVEKCNILYFKAYENKTIAAFGD
jgi:hypothetical protein